VLIYLIPVALAVILFLVLGYLVMRRPETCPGCGKRALRLVTIIGTRLGPKETQSDAYLECTACGSHWVQRNGQGWRNPDDQEWQKALDGDSGG
jgi:hypothetical protein